MVCLLFAVFPTNILNPLRSLALVCRFRTILPQQIFNGLDDFVDPFIAIRTRLGQLESDYQVSFSVLFKFLNPVSIFLSECV